MRTRIDRRSRPRPEALEGRALLSAGVLDPSFGGGSGDVLSPEPIGGNSGDGAPLAATALYPQSDPGDPADAGKIVVVGDYNTGTKDDFRVIRYNPDGTLDPSFGGTGAVTTSFNNLNNDARAVAIQTDGKIVVGGHEQITGYPSFESEFALARYNTNGTLDTTFGKGGLVTSKFALPKGYVPYDNIWSVALEPNGEILAGGNGDGVSQFGGKPIQAFTLALYRANGQLDTSFGTGGVAYATLNASTSAYALYDVGLQTVNGTTKIIEVGRSNPTSSGGALVMVARYNLNGTLDGTFGAGGIASFPNMAARAGAIQPDGSIIAAGCVQTTVTINGHLYGSDHMSLVRFTAGGSPDTTFGQGGQVVTAFTSGDDVSQANAVVIQPDGAIVAGGVARQSGSPGTAGNPLEPALARYTPSGQLDTTFGAAGTGLVVTPVDSSPPDNGQLTGLALQSDGSIVAAGYAEFGTSNDFLVARYLGDPPPSGPAAAVADPSLIPLVLDDSDFLGTLAKPKPHQAA